MGKIERIELRERLKTPLLMTEHVRGIEPKADFLVAAGTDMLRADPEYDLGITGAMKIAHLAEAFGMEYRDPRLRSRAGAMGDSLAPGG